MGDKYMKLDNRSVQWRVDGRGYSFTCAYESDANSARHELNRQQQAIDTLRTENEKMRAVVDAAVEHVDSKPGCYADLKYAVDALKPKTRDQLLDERLAAADALIFSIEKWWAHNPEISESTLSRYKAAKQAHEEVES